MNEDNVIKKVNSALDKLYKENIFLFENGLCEKSINHRFAVCLENEVFLNYYVDCEYNKSHGNGITNRKMVSNINGNYIDIVVTKRDGNGANDLICFETKMHTNKKRDGIEKDRENLKILTNGINYGYNLGFFIIYGRHRNDVILETYKNGNLYSQEF